jgi:hypothetical protein
VYQEAPGFGLVPSSYRRAEDGGGVDSTSVECVFSITPVSGGGGVGGGGDSTSVECLFSRTSLPCRRKIPPPPPTTTASSQYHPRPSPRRSHPRPPLSTIAPARSRLPPRRVSENKHSTDVKLTKHRNRAKDTCSYDGLATTNRVPPASSQHTATAASHSGVPEHKGR